MKFKQSFFDWNLLKKNISRYAPGWVLLTVAFFLAIPLTLMRRLDEEAVISMLIDAEVKSIAAEYLKNAVRIGVIFAFLTAVIFAALVFKYLHKTRSTYMMHAFPMTRTCLFVTNTVTGLLFWVVPALITGLCTLAVLAAYHVTGCGALVWSMLGKWLLSYLCFYGLAVFTMHLAGNTFIALLSYGALNYLFLFVPVLVLLLVSHYFLGFDYGIPDSFLKLAPIVRMNTNNGLDAAVLLQYAVLGMILLILAWVLYRFRHVERAGDPMVFGWARVAFRVIFTLCCALGLGWLLTGFFGLIRDTQSGSFLIFALLGCLIGWFSSSMMIERTVMVFRNKKVWLGFAAFAAVLIVAVVGLKYDLLGLQRKVPQIDKVESVEIWTMGTPGELNSDCITLTKADQIETVLAFHRRAVEEPAAYSPDRGIIRGDCYGTLHICYRLSNGNTLRRAYVVPANDHAALAKLYADPEIATAWYDRVVPKNFYRVTLYSCEGYEILEDGGESWSGTELECSNPSALRNAVLADAAAGRLPVMNFLVDDEFSENPNYSYSPELYFDMNNPIDPVRAGDRIVRIADTATETIALFK